MLRTGSSIRRFSPIKCLKRNVTGLMANIQLISLGLGECPVVAQQAGAVCDSPNSLQFRLAPDSPASVIRPTILRKGFERRFGRTPHQDLAQ